MRRIGLVFAAALALAGVGCDKDKQDETPQPGQTKTQEPQKPSASQLSQQTAIPSATAEKITAAASPADGTGITSGRVLFDGDKPRSGLPGDATGVWAGLPDRQRTAQSRLHRSGKTEQLQDHSAPFPLLDRRRRGPP